MDNVKKANFISEVVESANTVNVKDMLNSFGIKITKGESKLPVQCLTQGEVMFVPGEIMVAKLGGLSVDSEINSRGFKPQYFTSSGLLMR